MGRLQRLYIENQTIVTEYSDGQHKKWKFCTMAAVRNAGFEIADTWGVDRPERGSVNEEKTDNNISRTRSTIFELAFCNPWEWFFTATLNPEKYDRENLDKFHKDLTQWLRDYGKLHGCKIKFLLVPELHSDGKSWHMHGLLSGLPVQQLKQFKIGDKMGLKLAEKVKRGDLVYNWLPYLKKFGFCDLEPVRSHEAVSKYMTKYISKSLDNSVRELGAHMYYCSRGLNRAKQIKKGTMFADIAPDFVNDYCRITWVDDEETAISLINSIL